MQGSVYSTRIKECTEGCGRPESKTCPARRAGHTKWGYCRNTHKMPDGRWVQRRKQGFPTRKAAEDALVQVIGDVRAGTALTTVQRKVTVAEWADQWLAGKVKARPSTIRSYRLTLDHYIVPSLGLIPLAELRPEHLDAMLARMRDGRLRPQENRRKPDGLLTAKTVNHVFGILRTMINAAVKRRLLTWNPCVAIELEPAEHHEAKVWSPAEGDAFLAYAEAHGPAWAPVAYRLALRFGLRRGELAALRWSDVGDATLTVRRNAVAVGREVVIGEPKTRKGARSVPVAADPGLTVELEVTRQRQQLDREAAGGDWHDTGLIVCDDHGQMIPPWLLSETFRKLAQAAGLPVIRLHEARHTAGTIWLEAGIDFKIISEWLGHATVSITQDVYLHVRGATHDAAAAKAAAYLAAHTRSTSV
jgi:integrase